MKRYAIRNTKTGEIYPWLYDNKAKVERNKKDNEEVVTLRVEPTEPCEWCKEDSVSDETSGLLARIYYRLDLPPINGESIVDRANRLEKHDWSLCPNCGRSLTDDEMFVLRLSPSTCATSLEGGP